MTNEKSKAGAMQDGGLLSGFLTSERPWIHVTAQMEDHAMTLDGVPAKKFYRDAKTLVDTSAEVATYYQTDDLLPLVDTYNLEIEAMGGKMIYGENSMPSIDFREPLVKEPEDLRKLKTPDFYQAGRILFALDCIKFAKEYGVRQSFFTSPFSMAVGLRSYPALIKDMRKRPQFIHELFTFIIDEVIIPYLKVQKEYCGISLATGGDGWAVIPNLSVREMKEWLVPYNQRVAEKTREFGMIVGIASGDYCEERPEKFDVGVLHGSFDVQIASQGTPSLFLAQGLWQDYPLEPVREYTAKYREQGVRVPILAGVNARLIRDGPVDKIVSTIKRFIDAFARDHELTILLANVPADTPPNHVHAAVAAVHTYGRKPIADNLDEIEFKLPERESFQEWRKKVAEAA